MDQLVEIIKVNSNHEFLKLCNSHYHKSASDYSLTGSWDTNT